MANHETDKPRQMGDIVAKKGITGEVYARLRDAHRFAAGLRPHSDDVPQVVADFLELRQERLDRLHGRARSLRSIEDDDGYTD